jgi:hypothetical protein
VAPKWRILSLIFGTILEMVLFFFFFFFRIFEILK